MEQYNKREVMQSIDDTNLFLMIKEPFYAHLFSGLNKEIKTEIPTACIAYHKDSNYLGLWVNPNFWNEDLKGPTNHQTDKYRFGVIKHEILHIVYKHIFRAADFHDKKLFNLAADIVVNQQINSDELIEGACTISKFPDFNLKTNDTLEYYYNALKQEKDKLDKMNNNSGGNSGDKDNDQQKSDNNQSSGNDANKNDSQKNLEKFYGQDDDHSEWSEVSGEMKGMEDLINSKIEAQLQEIANKLKNTTEWGKLPSFIKDYIENSINKKPAVINWKTMLRKFATSSQTSFIKNTIRRPSKRYGTSPGIKIKHKQKLLVAIDTSGSVDNESLLEFFSEINHIYKNGASIRILECDTQIHAEYDYKGIPPNEITGRGGTDFNAPFVYAQNYNPDAIVYFTDGYCSPPTVKVRTDKVMWIICRNHGIDLNSFKSNGFKGISVKMY